MDGWQSAFQTGGRTQFTQRQVGLLGQQPLPMLPMAFKNLGLAPGKMVARSNITCAAALLEQFLNHAKRNPKAMRHLLTATFPRIVTGQYPLSQIHRQRLHHPTRPTY